MNLGKKQLEILSHAVEARHAALSSAAQTHVRQLRDDEFTTLAGAVGDAVDQATAEVIRDGDNAVLVRDAQELRELEAARSRLAGGEYGICIDCGLEIAHERLSVRPGAARCVFCQELFERTHFHPEGKYVAVSA